nr:MAG TPA: hypothetical protein [Caudoviricetes sp.]
MEKLIVLFRRAMRRAMMIFLPRPKLAQLMLLRKLISV